MAKMKRKSKCCGYGIRKIDNIIYPKYYQSKDENQAPPEGGSDG